jgi:DNA-binding beta-propeller fold protein YncE
MGEIYALDAGTSTLLAFGPEGRFRSVLAKFESRPRALAAWHGTLFVLLPEPGEISVIHPSKGAGGATSIPLRGPGWEIRDAAGMALDTLGSLYILDDKAGSVTVLDRTGQRVASIVPARGEPGDLRSATALAVDASGVVYVAGRREPGVSRFR